MVLNDLIYDWAEIIGTFLGALALIISVLISNSRASYPIVFLFGLCFGRLLFRFKNDFKAPVYVIISFFYIGYLIGSFDASKIFISALFFFSIFIAYQAHDKGFLHSIEY